MGSSFVENTGTDADTVDMVGAFKAKGFGLNQTVADMYEALQPTFKSESRAGAVRLSTTTSRLPPRPAFSPARSRVRLRWTARTPLGKTA